jgi:hypothetical protein
MCEHTLRNGESAKDETQVHSHFESCTRVGVVNVQSLGERANQCQIEPQDIIKKVLKCKCLKGLHIVHLDIIGMSCDQKKGQESNWEFDS